MYSDVFYECPNPDACAGNSNSYPDYSYTGECSTGYTGNQCQACDAGYSRTSKNLCGACPEPETNAFRLLGILCIVVIVACIMVRTSM